MTINIPTYEVELRLDGVIIGNIRQLAQNLTWAKRRTRAGVDTIDFTINDVQFEKWLNDRGSSLTEVLRPLALDCRVIRNGVAVVGGFLATMPAYSPNGTSANLQMRFDGYLNLLDGVYMDPMVTQTGRMSDLIVNWITMADARAEAAGKAFGFTAGNITQLASVQYTNENYKSVKEAITDRCDNISGAGEFDVYFHPDRTYDIAPSSEFGDVINTYLLQYPTRLNGVSITSIRAAEIDGFASSIIGVGAGEIAPDEEAGEQEALIHKETDEDAVKKYGYREAVYQHSSVSTPEVLQNNVESRLAKTSNIDWQPQITLSGRQIAPTPEGDVKIWVGDTVTIKNSEDITGMTTGAFRVNELEVKVGSTGAETITPTLSSGDGAGMTFAEELIGMKRELLALKTYYRKNTAGNS